MRVYKRTRTVAGQEIEYPKWYVEFRDHLEKPRRVAAYTDRGQSQQLGKNIEKLVSCRANAEPPDRTLKQWLQSIPPSIRRRLVELDLIDGQRAAASKPLSEHVNEYEAVLLARGRVAKHVKSVVMQIRRLVKMADFKGWHDVSASKVERAISKLAEEEKLSLQTLNFYLQATKQFCRWMVEDGRAEVNPLQKLKRQNVDTDRRHDRRTLSVDEVRWLLTATEEAPVRCNASGPERVLIYRLALETGLRAAEIHSLKKNSFDFDARPATVTVEAGYSKRRREDVLPLRPALAESIKQHLATKLPAARAFNMPMSDKTSRMLKADLAAARAEWLEDSDTPVQQTEREKTSFLAYADERGLVADFHALRHTFISNLANSGVHPKVAQQLARHSTITLTMDRYTHTVLSDLNNAIEVLPDLAQPVVRRATGTDGRPKNGAPSGALLGSDSCNPMRPGAVKEPSASAEGKSEKPLENKAKASRSKRMGRDSNPRAPHDASSFQDCRLRPLGHPSRYAGRFGRDKGNSNVCPAVVKGGGLCHAILSRLASFWPRFPAAFAADLAIDTTTPASTCVRSTGRRPHRLRLLAH